MHKISVINEETIKKLFLHVVSFDENGNKRNKVNG